MWQSGTTSEEKAGIDVMLEYVTTRELEGRIKGRIRILKLKGEGEAEVEYTCPSCGHTEKLRKEWKEPFVNGSGINQFFLLNCGKCGFTIKLLKLRKEIKKKDRLPVKKTI